jgi:hypothetical protein
MEYYQSCHQETPGGRSHLAKEQAAPAYVGDDDEKQDVADGATVTRKKSVLRESSGWTVIQEIAEPDSSDRIEEEVEEEYNQLVEDEEYQLSNEATGENVEYGVEGGGMPATFCHPRKLQKHSVQ